MGRMGIRLVAAATVAVCLAACLAGGAPAARANGGKTIAEAGATSAHGPTRGRLYDGAFYSGFSVAYWGIYMVAGDRMTIRTKSTGGATPPCQILFMPGTDDSNVSSTTPILDPATQTRHGSVDLQRFVEATDTGAYVLAMTNSDIFLSGPHQCLDAPAGKPFTFTVTVAHSGSGSGSDKTERSGNGGGSGGSTHVVEPGQSLWVIAQNVVSKTASIGQIAFEVGRLWQLNAPRIGTGDPDLIFPGQTLRLK
jgi:nucleoid-associated protein YgaU